MNSFLVALPASDVFLYAGHNAGEQYVGREVQTYGLKSSSYFSFCISLSIRLTSRQKIQNLPKCGVALLMGCSSGKLEDNGDFDASGNILAYVCAERCHAQFKSRLSMTHSSPAIVGNLWVVTDKDLDRITTTILEEWKPSTSLLGAISQPRAACYSHYNERPCLTP